MRCSRGTLADCKCKCISRRLVHAPLYAQTITYISRSSCSELLQLMHCGVRRYQGYDWRDRRNWGCNNQKSPVGQGLFYNSTLSQYDLFFVKVKTSLLEAGDTAAQQAVKYTQ